MDTIQFIPTGVLQYRIRYAYRTEMPPELDADGIPREVLVASGPSRSPIEIDLEDSDAESEASVSLLSGTTENDVVESTMMRASGNGSPNAKVGKRPFAENG